MEDVFSVLSVVQVSLLVASVIGAVEAVKAAFDHNWRTVAIICVAGLLGGLGACLLVGFTALAFFAGVSVGLGASGVVTVARK